MPIIYGEVTDTQLAGVGGGAASTATAVGPFVAGNTSTTQMGYGVTNYAYAPVGNGSIIGASIVVSSGQTGTVSVGIYKNMSLIVTAFTNMTFNSTAFLSYVVTYTAGTYPYVANDQLLMKVTAQSTGLSIVGSLVLTSG